MAAALERLGPAVDPTRVDELWVFAPRPLGERESALVLLSLYEAPSSERRRILTLRSEWSRALKPKPPTDILEEHGSCPSERVERLVAGLVRRMGEESQEPAVVKIEGDAERWRALLAPARGPA
jgi:hypothetical protein